MKKNTIEIQKEKKGEPIMAILTLESDITFANSKELLDNFYASKGKFDILVMQGNIDSMDLTGIQALYSIRKYLQETDKLITIGLKMNEETKSFILRAGFKEIFETL